MILMCSLYLIGMDAQIDPHELRERLQVALKLLLYEAPTLPKDIRRMERRENHRRVPLKIFGGVNLPLGQQAFPHGKDLSPHLSDRFSNRTASPQSRLPKSQDPRWFEQRNFAP
jgi:hypothetical protein